MGLATQIRPPPGRWAACRSGHECPPRGLEAAPTTGKGRSHGHIHSQLHNLTHTAAAPHGSTDTRPRIDTAQRMPSDLASGPPGRPHMPADEHKQTPSQTATPRGPDRNAAARPPTAAGSGGPIYSRATTAIANHTASRILSDSLALPQGSSIWHMALAQRSYLPLFALPDTNLTHNNAAPSPHAQTAQPASADSRTQLGRRRDGGWGRGEEREEVPD